MDPGAGRYGVIAITVELCRIAVLAACHGGISWLID